MRRPPRGVKKSEYARRDYYDVWLPELAPSEELRVWALSQPWSAQRWATFARRYRAEMAAPAAAHLLSLLRALAESTSFAIGCYCQEESQCHRSLLLDLIESGGTTAKRHRATPKAVKTRRQR